MTDDLMARLKNAGDLLDQRGDQSLGTVSDDDGLRVFAIAPPAPARGRRGPGVLAAAAAVFVVALVAAVAWNGGGEQQLGVAAGGGTVALVPSSGLDGWDRIRVTNDPIDPNPAGGITIVPSDETESPDERLNRALSVSVMPHDWFEGGYTEQAGWRPVSGAGLQGHFTSEGDRSMMLTKPADTPEGLKVIMVTGGPGTDVDMMLAVASLVDMAADIEDQELPGWDILTRNVRSQLGGHAHTAEFINDDGSGGFLSVTTLTSVEDEALIAWLPPYAVNGIEVRGHAGWAASWEGSMITITWLEAPGVVVQLAYGSSLPHDQVDPDQVRAEALAAAEDLVEVDAAGWAELAAQATPTDQFPITSTSLPSGTAQHEGPADAVIPGETADGREYSVWSASGQVCWSFAGQSGQDCEDDEAHHVDGRDHSVPRLASDPEGQSAFLYGFLPVEASSVQVSFLPVSSEAEAQGPVRDAGFSRAGRLWVTTIPAGYQADLVTYFHDGDEFVESHQASAGTGRFHD